MLHKIEEQVVINAWDKIVFGASDKVIEKSDWNFTHLINYLPSKKDIKILDVGSGNGRHVRGLQNMGYREVVGIDLLKPTQFSDIDYRRGSITKIPFPDETFDVIYSLASCVSHVENPEEWTKEFERALKPGGKIIVSAHSLHSTHTLYRLLKKRFNAKEYDHIKVMTFCSTAHNCQALEKYGLKKIAVTGYRPSLVWYWRPVYNRLLRPALSRLRINIPFAWPFVSKTALFQKINSVIGYQIVYVYEKP